MKRTLIVVLLHAFAAPSVGWAAADAGVEDLLVHAPEGAEAAALGGAYSSMGRRGEVLFYNPAELDRLTDGEASLDRAVLAAGSSLDSLLAAWPFAAPGGAAVALRRLASDGAVGRDTEGLPTGVFAYDRWELSGGYGRAVQGPLALGVAAHADIERLGDARAAGFGIDGGAQWVEKRWAAGLSIQNLASLPRRLGSVVETNLPEVRVGGSTELGGLASGWRVNGRAAADVEWIPGRVPIPHVGAAFFIWDLEVRGGWTPGEPSVGLGVHISRFRIDYAASIRSDVLIHRVALSLDVGETRTVRQQRLLDEEKERLTQIAPLLAASTFARQHVVQGRDALAAGLIPMALREFAQAAKLAPDDPEVRAALADGQARARKESETATKKARQAEAEGRWYDAEQAWSEATELSPEDGVAREGLSRARDAIQAAVGRYVEQQQKLLAAQTQLSDTRRELETSRGEISAVRRQADAAQHYAAGVKAYYEGRLGEAVVELEATSALAAHFDRVDEFLRRAKIREASPSKEMKPELMALYREGMSYYLRGRYDLAIQSWEKILQSDPTNPLALRNIQEAKRRLAESQAP